MELRGIRGSTKGRQLRLTLHYNFYLGMSFGFSLVRYYGVTIGVTSVFENTYKVLRAKIATFVSNYLPLF